MGTRGRIDCSIAFTVDRPRPVLPELDRIGGSRRAAGVVVAEERARHLTTRPLRLGDHAMDSLSVDAARERSGAERLLPRRGSTPFLVGHEQGPSEPGATANSPSLEFNEQRRRGPRALTIRIGSRRRSATSRYVMIKPCAPARSLAADFFAHVSYAPVEGGRTSPFRAGVPKHHLLSFYRCVLRNLTPVLSRGFANSAPCSQMQILCLH